MFGDPQLNRLEELVNVNNQNVKLAEAQFRQARSLVLSAHANYYPTIGQARHHQSDVGRIPGGKRRHQPELLLARHRILGTDLWAVFACLLRTRWTTRRSARPIWRISGSASTPCSPPITSCCQRRTCR